MGDAKVLVLGRKVKRRGEPPMGVGQLLNPGKIHEDRLSMDVVVALVRREYRGVASECRNVFGLDQVFA